MHSAPVTIVSHHPQANLTPPVVGYRRLPFLSITPPSASWFLSSFSSPRRLSLCCLHCPLLSLSSRGLHSFPAYGHSLSDALFANSVCRHSFLATKLDLPFHLPDSSRPNHNIRRNIAATLDTSLPSDQILSCQNVRQTLCSPRGGTGSRRPNQSPQPRTIPPASSTQWNSSCR